MQRAKTISIITLLPLILTSLLFLLPSCKNENEPPEPEPTPSEEYTITIRNVHRVPDHVKFDKVVVNIIGTCWEVIDTIEATFEDGSATLILPDTFPSDKLQQVDHTDGNMCGHWPAVSDNPEALVAGLGDMIAYDNDIRVGRFYLSDWPGEGDASHKSFAYFQYADRSFNLKGWTASFFYRASFEKGWNIYVNINPEITDEQTAGLCTTTISSETELEWRFESWVY